MRKDGIVEFPVNRLEQNDCSNSENLAVDEIKSTTEPHLLCVRNSFRTVNEALNYALKMKLSNVLILSELPDGSLDFFSSEMTLATTNWILDRMKWIMLDPNSFARRDDNSSAS